MQVEKFFKTIKRAGHNRRAGRNFFTKSINVQTKIRPCRGEFFLKINKRACTSIRYTRVVCSSRDKAYSGQMLLKDLNEDQKFWILFHLKCLKIKCKAYYY